MTNKTIIGGIDISNCSYYDHEQYFECEISSCHCKEINNCYFKQLARAKEEIEKLRNLQDDLVKRNEELQNKLQALDEIERLLKDALDAEKTNTDESFENFYKCLEIIKKTKEVE